MASITVCGVASAAVQPDFVVVTLGVTSLAPDPATALDEIASMSVVLTGVLAARGLNAADWATEGVTVAEEHEWKQDTNVLVGHRATSGVAATVRDLGAVGALLRDAVTQAGANVRDLSWRVDADNPARRTLLADAAGDAKVRAEAYAGALQLRLGAVEWISELPPAAPDDPPALMLRRQSKSSDAAPLSVSGGRIELTANVYVRFATLNGG